ncbi:phosphate ABC transporter substrate-binding protein PstS [Gloeothece verrucosa]|uniref:Phosphate-binding protein n=1 Tax=Gloeothece verrucosa (strain PCC 7822) TaxID=497965 RepID=E0UFA1_GLOV7|nr:phosphate ABC transporter substrate-binding protein PstS [Gloeothece verrucosa]ADN15472.1 phosphate ABC transporter, periplasmic phosphate-binding protein [Gloeothece verrucosa PCC 7822]
MLNQKNLRTSPRDLINFISILALSISLGACGSANNTADTGQGQGQSGTAEQTPAAAGGDSLAKALALAQPVRLTGAGASFPYPLYSNWFVQLNQEVPDLQVNYQSVGSGAGVEQFIQGTINFGASDVAMKDEEIAKVQRGVLTLPMTAGAIVLAYNIPGVQGELKLSRDTYVGIFLGEITNWNDPKIAKDNPDVKLPDLPITVVHRADGSGTTAVFTQHLSAISDNWKSKIGAGKTVQWPKTGKFIGAKGNEGITASIQQNQGSIGYVEAGYAKNNKLSVASLQNKAGQFVAPTEESEAATLASVTLPENLRAFITDPEGEKSYPIVTYTWMLVYKKYDDPNIAKGIEGMIQYGLTQGQKSSAELGYIPLPQNVVEKVAAAADQISPDFQIKVK